jgi:hypothetical protein
MIRRRIGGKVQAIAAVQTGNEIDQFPRHTLRGQYGEKAAHRQKDS